MKITPEIMRIVDYIELNPNRTTADISSRYNLYRYEALGILNRLVELKILQKTFKHPHYQFTIRGKQ